MPENQPVGQYFTYRIFLASSQSLAPERGEFEREVETINRTYARYNIRVELVLWEILDSAIFPGGKQKQANIELSTCDFLVLIYWGEIGLFTLEEYRLALNLMETGSKIKKIFIYEKTSQIPDNLKLRKKNIVNLNKLKKELRKKGQEQWTVQFEDSNKALRKFGSDIREFISHTHFLPIQTPNTEVIKYHNLISDRRLFGRDKDVQTISACIQDATKNPLTLIGPGGTGKSTLANRVAHENESKFSNGAIFVELAPLGDKKQIVPAIVKAFDPAVILKLSEKSEEEELVDFLKDKNIIIILDNCEYLVEECRYLVKEIVKRCRGVKIIATSQIALSTSCEHLIQIGPLIRPNENKPAEIALNPCIQLFLNATNVEPKLKLSKDTQSDIIAICNLRAGIPLGIILAASALKLKSLEDIRKGIEKHFSNSSERLIDDYDHHETINLAIDWSYNLLDEEQKALFLRLAVFKDDFTAEAAEMITNISDNFESNFLRLIDINILTRSTSHFLLSRTFFLLEPIKQYGKMKLDDQAFRDTCQRFIDYYVGLAQYFSHVFFIGGRERQLKEVDKIDEQYNNIIEVFSLARSFEEWSPSAKICGSLWRFWEVKGRFKEGISHIENVLENSQIGGEIYLELLHGLGMLYYRGGSVDHADVLFNQHLTASMEFEGIKFGKINKAHALNNIANSKSTTNTEKSRELLLGIHAVFAEYDDKRMMAVLENNLGNLCVIANDLPNALEYFTRSKSGFEEQENRWESGYPLYGLGCTYFLLSRYTEAKNSFDEAYERRKKFNDKRNMGRCEYYLSLIELKNNNLEKALERIEASSALLSEVNDLVSLCELGLVIVQYCYSIGFYAMAIRLFYYLQLKGKEIFYRIDYLRKISVALIKSIESHTDPEILNEWKKEETSFDEQLALSQIKIFIEQKKHAYE